MVGKSAWCIKNVFKAKWCAKHHLRNLAKFYMLLNSIFCNCYIDYRASISKDCAISHHGTGVVINASAVIGKHVFIGHGVTIGNRMPKDGRSPKIGNNVYIGSGAYLGGGITIGDNVMIGAHSVVIRDVPPNSTVVGNPTRILGNRPNLTF